MSEGIVDHSERAEAPVQGAIPQAGGAAMHKKAS